MSKENIVLQYMLDGGSLTVVTCKNYCQTTELRSIVPKLKKRGIPVLSKWETGFDANGNATRFKRYWVDEQYIAALR